jgi:hypothetical protein
MGNLKRFRYLYKAITLDNFNLSENSDLLFRKACTSGNISLVRYLIEESNKQKNPININAFYDNAFKRACKYNHNQLVKYLYYLSLNNNKPININLGSSYCFRIACRNGNEFLVRFLYTVSKMRGIIININTLNDQAFRWACENNNCKIARLLWKISKSQSMPIDIKSNDNQLFMTCCNNNQIELVNLLMKIVPNYYYVTIHENKITKYGLLTNVRKSLSILQDMNLTLSQKRNPCNILGIKKTVAITVKDNTVIDNNCNICYSRITDITKNNKLVKLCCDHVYCLECLLITHDQQEADDDSDVYDYDKKLKCFRSTDPDLRAVQCTYCKKSSTWQDCVILNQCINTKKK